MDVLDGRGDPVFDFSHGVHDRERDAEDHASANHHAADGDDIQLQSASKVGQVVHPSLFSNCSKTKSDFRSSGCDYDEEEDQDDDDDAGGFGGGGDSRGVNDSEDNDNEPQILLPEAIARACT